MSSSNCWETFFCKIAEELDSGNGIDETAAEKAAKSFVDAFDNPEPIIKEIGESIKGFGERTMIFIFVVIFLIISILLWTFVGLEIINWVTALLITFILLIVMFSIIFIYRTLIEIYIDIQAKIILDSFKKWLNDERKKVIPAASRAACVYSEGFVCPLN